MGIFDDDEDTEDVMRVDPSALSTGWSALVDGLSSMEETASETASSAYETATQTASQAYTYAEETASSGYDAAAQAATDGYTYVEETASSGYDAAAEVVVEEYDAAAQAASEEYDAAAEVVSEEYDAAAEVVTEEYDAAAEVVSEEYDVVATAASDEYDAASKQVDEYITTTEQEAEADPLGFAVKVTSAISGAPTVTVDTDSSDGTMSLHASSWMGKVDADWAEGQGSHVTSQVGMDWGAAPYLKTDLKTDAEGNITHLDGTAKITVPVEGVSAKGEWQGSYDKTAEGYKVEYSQQGGVSLDGVELMGGVKGGIDDHGDRGMVVHGGPQASVGTGTLAPAEGFDIVEGAVKGNTDLSYGNLDGHTTVGVQQTVGTEGKVFGQQVSGNQNVLGVTYVDGPNGEKVIIQDTVSSSVGHDSVGKVGVSDSGTVTIGLHDDGPVVESVVGQQHTTVTGPGATPVYDQTVTASVDDPFADDVAPADGAPDESWEEQPLVLTNPDESWEEQPLVLTNADDVFAGVLDEPAPVLDPLPAIDLMPVIDDLPSIDPMPVMGVVDEPPLVADFPADDPLPDVVYGQAPIAAPEAYAGDTVAADPVPVDASLEGLPDTGE